MAGNSFSTEEIVAFEQILEGFEDREVMSHAVSRYTTDDTTMARTNNVIWRPQPYIGITYDGTDQTGNFNGRTELSVPATLGYSKSSPWSMTALELRDALQEKRLGESAKQKLASDINKACLATASAFGTLVVKRTTPASGFDDVAQADAIMNEQGIPADSRYFAVTSRDYNGMASDLQKASRSLDNDISSRAYRQAYVGEVASFTTMKLDYGNRLTAAAGTGITMDTRTSAGNYYVPKATVTDSVTGASSNVDNRFQTITVSSTTNVAAGDAFTIANIDSIHHIAKVDTGQLKTFRVVTVASSTTLVITPPIISNQGGSIAEQQYQNVVNTSPASNAALVWMNTVTAAVNPFWHKDAIELLPGRYAIPMNAGAQIMTGTTDTGIQLSFQKFYDIDTMLTKFRVDIFFGVNATNPEMMGIELFNQT